MLEHLSAWAEILKPYYPHLALTTLVWITYYYATKCGFVSDDHQGLGDYDGKLQGLEYGMISRWVRYHLCGGEYPSKLAMPDGRKIPEGKLSRRHHILSIVVFNAGVLLAYNFLSSLFTQSLALSTLVLFVVSPLGTQTVAWISGLGYPLSFFWIFVILNYLTWFHEQPVTVTGSVVACLVFIVMDIMAINALFVALALPAILLFLGYYQFAAIAVLISIGMGLRIVKHTINIRAVEFKKQDMGNLTRFKIRRVLVAFKTIFYYLELVIWPNKLGLYHEWGNHFTHNIERLDKRFFLGLIATAGLVAIFFLSPVLAVKFGILWFFAFIFIFLNWITIQQFVAERYLWIPSLGFYLIVAYVLQGHTELFYLLTGILLCRTWLHLPTYDDELRFYLSNTWNYQSSEVALANLGCTFIRLGAVGSAIDTWHAAIKCNPDYDVPYANIYFHHRSAAMLDVEHGNYEFAIEKFKVALRYIEGCNNCSVKHFKDDWKRELDNVTAYIRNPLLLVLSEKTRLTELKKTLLDRLSKLKPDEPPTGIQESLGHIDQRMVHIENILQNAPKDKLPTKEEVEGISSVSVIIPGSGLNTKK